MSPTPHSALPSLPTLTGLSAALSRGETTPHAIVERALRRAREADCAHVFCALDAMRVLQTAARATERWQAGQALGAFDGIPISWKDLFDQAGEITRAASLTTKGDAPKLRNAVCVTQLEALGMVSFGRTNMTEFAFSGLGLNPHFGTPVNAWSRGEALAPGGSSAGAALSVARGIVPVAMGSDTSGSVRIPAALNGLAGFRPTAARVSRIGVWALSPTLDSVGPLAHTVEDICLLMRLFAVDAEPASGGSGGAAIRTVVPAGMMTEDVEPQIRKSFEHSLARLERAGAEIIRKPLRALDRLAELFDEYGTLVGIEAWQLHQGALALARLMDARVAKRLQANAAYPLQNLFHLLAWRVRLQEMLAGELQGALLLMPTTAIDAPPLRRLEDDEAFFVEANRKILRNTMAGSFLDLPGLTIPTGVNENGLPGALLVCADSGRDESVLGAGRAIAHWLTGDRALNEERG